MIGFIFQIILALEVRVYLERLIEKLLQLSRGEKIMVSFRVVVVGRIQMTLKR